MSGGYRAMGIVAQEAQPRVKTTRPQS